MHFFSPVPVMPLVELIRGSATTDETEAAIRELTEALGKKAHRLRRTGRGSSSIGS